MVFSDLFFLFVFIPAFVICYFIAGRVDKRLSKPSASTYEIDDSDELPEPITDTATPVDDAAYSPSETGTAEPSGGAASVPVFKQKHIVKNIILVVFSLLFYAWGEPVYIFLMLATVVVNYFVGRGIGATLNGMRKFWLIVGVAVNLGVLASFKYLNFFAEILRDCGLDVADPKISLPIGISFYIFQSISYLVDVYRRESAPQKSFWGLLLYISMFPQLIAGPIVRYSTVAKQIHNRHATSKDIADGIFRFLLGLGKKVILANMLGEVATQLIGGNNLSHSSIVGALIGILAFTFQIYFDFSGYSDMAIGIGRCLGFHFNENFDHPYISKSITEFWRRWHMSLGSFFRDYVYIPLGGNRAHQLVNILIVWFLTGMWHGASWNFILWGLYFGIILLVEKRTILKIKDKVPAPLLHIYSIIIIVFGWAIFYFTDFNQLTNFFRIITGQTHAPFFTIDDESLLFEKFWLFFAALLFCTPIRKGVSNLAAKWLTPDSNAHHTVETVARVVVSCAILVISVALLVGATNNAFLYTRF